MSIPRSCAASTNASSALLLATALSLTLAAVWQREVSAAADRPNVLFILVDDLGWSDVSYNGSEVYETPAVDRLAEQGMVLADFYSAGPVCSPTRASIMTGKSPARLGLTKWLYTPAKDPPFVAHHLPLEEFTIAEALGKAGYATGYFGKWHLGYRNEHWAGKQGFATAIGGIDSIHAWELAWPDRRQVLPDGHRRFFSPYRMTHMEDGPEGEYLTERLTDETIAFIERQTARPAGARRPFFAFLSFHTVHTPLEPREAKLQKYRRKIASLGLDQQREQNPREKAYQNNPAYAAMVEHMDDNVGRLLHRLDELDLADNTLVIWTSDNGGKGSVTSNLPLRGMKHNLYEGGIRVPTIVRWPGRIAAGSRSETPLVSTDFYPTLLQLTGCEPLRQQHLDGVGFADVLLSGSAAFQRGDLFWHYPHSRNEAAVRSGQYKLLYRMKSDAVELYDLKSDLGERQDLSGERPQLAAELKGRLQAWQRKVNARFAD